MGSQLAGTLRGQVFAGPLAAAEFLRLTAATRINSYFWGAPQDTRLRDARLVTLTSTYGMTSAAPRL